MARKILLILIMTCLAVVAPKSYAQTHLSTTQQELLLQEGQVAFDRGITLQTADPMQAHQAFETAIERWQTLADSGVTNGAILYNLGNAQVQAGELGKGIASYLRAREFMPGDARLSENLEYARSLVSPQFTADGAGDLISRLMFWHREWSVTTRIIIFGIAWGGGWMLLLARRFVRFPGSAWWSGSAMVIGACFAASVAVSLINSVSGRGVIVQNDVIVRKGDGEAYQPRFEEPIHRGVEFRILESRPIWLHVEFPNGDDGWIPRGAAEVVRHQQELLASA